MGQKKLIRFAELKTFSNVLQYPEAMNGKWKEFFHNDNPITLELACGKGEYAVGLGQLYPQKNLIGIDQKGNRIWVGAKKALQLQLSNVAFLRIQIDRITEYFSPNEVKEIWKFVNYISSELPDPVLPEKQLFQSMATMKHDLERIKAKLGKDILDIEEV
jgi:tRNA G46 methylase TrmB